MKTKQLTFAAGLVLAAGVAHAAGPLYLWEGGSEPQPYKWDTSETIPVYTDGGDAFTFDFDGVTPFITIERANEITQFGFDNWNSVPTSTFEAAIAGTIESQTGIADVTGANAHLIYDAENGYGFWVNYDTDGSILEDYFGVPRTAVLGIAFPELADESTGEIVEATAVINGWNVYDTDIDGNQVAGVFTHEFGHAINLSHSQTNGHVAYLSRPWAPYYPGVNGCDTFPALADVEVIETMFPFIDHGGPRGEAQSTINMPDDIAAISNLYPTDDYASSTGSISGVLRLKDGKMEYSGINVIARNVNDIYGDAVSAMTGDQTQGLLGPDGRYTINNLTPGEEYVLYIETIKAGGYPTSPTPIVSQAEYWNDAESNDPVLDDACDATPILAEAGVTKSADITFNGYMDGIQYTPIVQAFLVDLAKNGRKSAGLVGNTAFVWDQNHGFTVLPPEVKANNGSMTRNGQKMVVQHDFSGNGIQQAAFIDFQGNSQSGDLVSLGDLNGDSCGGSGAVGVSSSYGWAVDDAGHTAVGLAYIDVDGDGVCQTASKGELVPWIWTPEKANGGGMRQLATEGLPRPTSWLRAQAISGNGQVVLGNNGGSAAVAWVNEGPLIDLYNGPYRVRDAYAVNQDGSRVALDTFNDAVVLWNPYSDEYTEIGGLTWCVDIDFISRGRNFCDLLGDEVVQEMYGPIPVLPLDMNDDGTVIIGRAGSFFSGFVGGIWVEGLGWIGLTNFLRQQGVMEAWDFPMDNPISIDGTGDTLVGGLAGATMSWHVDMNEVFVCRNGKSQKTSFPEGLIAQIGQGAELGRCEFID